MPLTDNEQRARELLYDVAAVTRHQNVKRARDELDAAEQRGREAELARWVDACKSDYALYRDAVSRAVLRELAKRMGVEL